MLDTNAVTAIIKYRAKTLSAILNERPSCISVITEAELRFGLARRAVNTELRDLRDGAQLNSPQERARFGEEAKRAWAE